MNLNLNGKVAVVTGASRGIGRAIAETLAEEGARIAAISRDASGRLQDTVRGIEANGGEAIAIGADVGREAAVQSMVQQVLARFGRIDILVNNAGIAVRKALVENTLEEWDDVLRTNLTGYFLCSRLVARHLIERKAPGRIVNISSLLGRVAKANMGAYCASKGGIDMLTRQFAVELAPHDIMVNVVAPGTISTEINLPLYHSTAPADVAVRTAMLKRVPLGRVGEPADIARMVAFLCSEATRYITGAIYYVDGGYTADSTPRV
jgi:NAD(P)-dependent dehydrogenase (short-subunit alcohol dehydrogenase family)